jgi:outer membrane lipoprotein LolB
VSARSRTPSNPDHRRYCLPVLLCGLLITAGCAVQRGVALPDMSDWSSRQAVLTGITDWSFSGRIGVKAGDEGFNGHLRWRQTSDAFAASVSGPLGAGTVQIDGNGRAITVVDKDGVVTRLVDPEAELYARYGWTIPVNSLRYWALGIPDPELPAYLNFGEDGTVTLLEQGGWTVEISQYREGGGQLMPRRISAVNSTSRVRLVIDNWVFY